MSFIRQHFLNVLILGDSRTGKSSLVKQYTDETCSTDYRPTLSSECIKKDFYFNDTEITLQIWDTPGEERFHNLHNTEYLNIHCGILVFDVGDELSFEHLTLWKDEFLFVHGEVPLIVIGNKVDLDSHRTVSHHRIQNWCQANGEVMYFDTSATASINVEQAFYTISQNTIMKTLGLMAEEED
eukprot:Phypoly_transcript_15900.p1 GENE.Phypoly_transcript_15900~~Phypoly_transcript_15900.p1  ORF type:complete len:183 (+),score=22.99 Phypoly_transcript_15900:266-814(+)